MTNLLAMHAYTFLFANHFTVGSRFATFCFTMFCFTTIHFYDPCPFGPSASDLQRVAVATQASLLDLVRFWLFSGVRVFLLFVF